MISCWTDVRHLKNTILVVRLESVNRKAVVVVSVLVHIAPSHRGEGKGVGFVTPTGVYTGTSISLSSPSLMLTLLI